MWSTVSSYFSNTSAGHSEERFSDSEDSDWVFVSHSGEEVAREDVFVQEEEAGDDSREKKFKPTPMSPLPLGCTKNRHSLHTSQISPAVSPSRMDGSWFITPPPCFTVKCASEIEKSPLEDLLIEHPSMSVYCSHQSQFSPCPVRSADENLFVPHSQDQLPLRVQKQVCGVNNKNTRYGPLATDNVLPCITLPEGHCYQLTVEEEQQQSEACDSSAMNVNIKNKSVVNVLLSLENCAIVAHQRKRHGRICQKSKASVQKKKLLPKKDNKNLSKPSKLVKQGNLSSSYITRQNRVQQMRNPFCQRNSHIIKPFGEKCKRQF